MSTQNFVIIVRSFLVSRQDPDLLLDCGISSFGKFGLNRFVAATCRIARFLLPKVLLELIQAHVRRIELLLLVLGGLLHALLEDFFN